MSFYMSTDPAPAQSAIYHLALALIRSGALDPAELVAAAHRVERDGSRDDPGNETWDEFAHALRLAALDVEDEMNKPLLDVIDGGKA